MARRRTPEPISVERLEERARLEQARASIAEAKAKARLASLRLRASSALTHAVSGASFSLGGYQSGKGRTRTSASRTLPPKASAQAVLDLNTRDIMRRECQDCERNNLVAGALVQRHIDFVDGDGPIVNPKTQDEKWNDEVRDLYRRFMQGEDYETLGRPNIDGRSNRIKDQREVTRVWDVCGDGCMIETVDENGLGSYQMIEAERLGLPSGLDAKAITNGTAIVAGLEMTAGGLATHYHFTDWTMGGQALGMTSRRIPATNVIYFPNPKLLRAGQVRGEPRLQRGLKVMDLLLAYIEDTAFAANTATWMNLIIEDSRPQDLVDTLRRAITDQPDRETSQSPYEVELGGGRAYITKPGHKVSQMKPEFPTTNFKDFVLTLIQLLGADFCLPLAIALFDAQQMSFSNMRGVLSAFARGIDFDQAEKAAIEKRVYRRKVAEWMNLGLISFRDDWDKVHVMFPRPPVVDLMMEIEAMGKAVDLNFTTRQNAIESIGLAENHIEVVRARKVELEREIEAGVAPADMPGATRPGTTPPTPTSATPITPDPAATTGTPATTTP